MTTVEQAPPDLNPPATVGPESRVGLQQPLDVVFLPRGPHETQHGAPEAHNLWAVGREVTEETPGGLKIRGALTNNPDLFMAMYESGPAALDDERFSSEPHELSVIENDKDEVAFSEAEPTTANVYGLILSSGVMTVAFRPRTGELAPVSAEFVDASGQEVVPADIEYGNDNNLSRFTGKDTNIVFHHAAGYQIPRVKEVYDRLGMTEPVYSEGENPQLVAFSAPTPATLKERLAEVRATMYVPELHYVETGHISPEEYVAIIAGGEFPVGVGNFNYYFHDVTAEHMAALIEYGEPLVDMMAHFAKAVQKSEVVHFTKFQDDDQHGDLSGQDKNKAAAQRLDNLTSILADVAIELHADDRRITGHRFDMISNLVEIMRESGELQGSIIERAVLDRGTVSSSEEITAEHVIEELVQLARERLGVQGLPKQEQEQEVQIAF